MAPKHAAPAADADVGESHAGRSTNNNNNNSSSVTAPASKYRKVDQREHVLMRPGMYIGSTEREEAETWVWTGDRMAPKRVTYTPGLVQVFMEVLTNAVDHSLRSRVTEIRVSIDPAEGVISVRNDGDGIDTSMTAEGVRGPELVFGHMLSSSNFDDGGEERLVAGVHGVGAKATNILSSEFTVETLDAANSKKKTLYRQTWRDNMAVKGDARLWKVSGRQHKPYTLVTFKPDWPRFRMPRGLDEDAIAVLTKCAVDASAVTPAHTSVFLGGERLAVKTFRDYCALYVEDRGALVFDKCGEDWEVAATCSLDGARQVSFVNGLCTPRGGKHVEHVVTQIAKKLAAKLSTKAKPVTHRTVRNSMWVFVKAVVPNPTFDSQNKHTLTTSVERFRSRYEPSEAFVRNVISKSGIAERINTLGIADDESRLKKSDGAQKRTITGIPKFEDAVAAGGPESHKCTLILTEGDSAKSTAIAGLAAIGRKYYGVFPLKGKPLNPRDASGLKISENEEIKSLKKILGLETGKDYSTPESRRGLRFGSVMCVCDADEDGWHILALVANIFHALWPSLIRIPGFLSSLRTPVVVARRGREKVAFYNMNEFEAWKRDERGAGSAWHSVFYKGIGLISSAEAREYFTDMKRFAIVCRKCEEVESGASSSPWKPLTVGLVVTASGLVRLRLRRGDLPQDDDDAVDMAFRKSRAEDRKAWLNALDKAAVIDTDRTEVRMKDFINRGLSHFSWDDVARSLPHVVDGLKESQRKILYGVKKRAANAGEIRVAQMAAYVGQVSAYRHGEASMQTAMIAMAQDFVGTGWVRLLHGQGQHGTRIMGGKDSASPRYIHTNISALATLMFPAADELLLQRAVDDDMNPIEARHYIPVLPVLLLNGSIGIGTGYSTNVPCFDPRLVAECYKACIIAGTAAGSDPFAPLRDPVPSYHGFRGTFVRTEAGRWASRGRFSRAGRVVEVTELPVGTWSADYKTFLDGLIAGNNDLGLKRFESHYTDTEVRFVLQFDTVASAQACDPYDALRLQSDRLLSTTNMHALDTLDGVRRYDTPADIAEEHYRQRYGAYVQRLVLQRDAAMRDVRFAEAREGFVADVVNKVIDIGNAPEGVIAAHAESRGWPRDDAAGGGSGSGFDYLANMPLGSLTRERHDRLVKDLERKRARLAELLEATPEATWAKEIDLVLAEILRVNGGPEGAAT